MNKKNDDLEKLSLFFLGNSSVGKTSFIIKYVNNSFELNHVPTIGIDMTVKTFQLETGEEIQLKFYDTAGQEQYRAISFTLIKSADGIFLVYDITQRKTFDDINRWIESIKEIKDEHFPIVLLGNKCDLEEKRNIDKEEGEKLAKDNGFPFIETSCKDGTNIKESVKILVSKIIEKKKEEKLKNNEEGEKENDKKGFQISNDNKNLKNEACITKIRKCI